MKYLLTCTDTYRVGTVEEVETLHEDLLSNPNFQLVAFSYKTKEIKAKGQVVEEYQVVSAKKVFNEEKNPDSMIDVYYDYPKRNMEDF